MKYPRLRQEAPAPGSAETADIRSILVVQTNRLGDCVLTVPSLHLLRRQFPDARLDVLCRPGAGASVFENVPDVDHVVLWDPGRRHVDVAGGWRIFRAARRAHYDASVCLYASPAPLWGLWAARVPLRIGRHTANMGRYLGRWLCNRVVVQDRGRAETHEACYNMDLLKPLGVAPERLRPSIDVPPSAREALGVLLREAGVAEGERLAVLHPGGNRKRPRMPVAFYAAIGDALAHLGARVVLTGGPDDGDLPAQVAAAMGQPAVDLSHRLDVPSLAALMARVGDEGLFVGADTGPMHLAAAFGVPVVVMVGRLKQRKVFPRWHPFGADYIAVCSEVVCPQCGPTGCVSHAPPFPCMEGLSLGAVLEAAEALWTGRPHPGRVCWQAPEDSPGPARAEGPKRVERAREPRVTL